MQATNTKSILLAGFGIFVLLGFSGSLNAQVPTGADISGTWVLNEAESDNPAEQMRRSREAGDRQEGRRRIRRGGSRMDREAIRERMEALKNQRMRFTIDQREDAVTLMYPSQGVVDIPTTGEEVTVAWPGLGDVMVRAVWGEDGTLEVERQFGRGFRTTTSYALNPEASRLIVVTKGGRRAREIRSVYDAAEE